MASPLHDPATGALRSAARILRGLLAAGFLLALVAALPWGLVHFIGWPLPQHVPTWGEVRTLLLTPLTTSLLLDVLACLLWPVWALFIADVVRASADLAPSSLRRPQPRSGEPLRAFAGALLAAILLAVLSSRSALTPAAAARPAVSHSAPAPATTPPVAGAELAAARTSTASAAVRESDAAKRRSAPRTVVVREPRDGIHDSLWRIAQRELGDGRLWPKIFTLNQGRPQEDGQTLTTPALIRPGWSLRLPPAPHHPGHHDQHYRNDGHDRNDPRAPRLPSPPETSAPSPDRSTPPNSQPPRSSPHTPPHHVPDEGEHAPHPGPGIALPSGAFVGAGLAALVTAALLTRRRRQRIRYRPGSGDREDLTIAPVVRALRLAQDHTGHHETIIGDLNPLSASTRAMRAHHQEDEPHVSPKPALPATAPSAGDEDVDGHIVAVREGQAVALDLARTRGLGLTGPGATGAARAVLTTLLAEQHAQPSRSVELFIPRRDAQLLLGADVPGRLTQQLHLVDGLEDALTLIEAELHTRTRDAEHESAQGTRHRQQIVLAATPESHHQARLQALLDNGSTLGIAAVLLGQWRAGMTARVRSDGTVAATSPELAGPLDGSRLFTLPLPDSQDVLDLLSTADAPAQQRETPATTAPEPSLIALPPAPAPAGIDSDRYTGNGSTDPRRATAPDRPATTTQTTAPPPATSPKSRNAFSAPSEAGQQDAAQLPPDAAVLTDEQSPAPTARTELAPDATPDDETYSAEHTKPLAVTLLGRFHLTHHADGESRDITASLAPKQRELLMHLAIQPGGARRETLATAIWPDAPADRPYNALHATLSQLRRALRIATDGALIDITRHHDTHYKLDNRQASVDLWDVHDALHVARSEADVHDRLEAVERISRLYRGDLAEDLSAEWIETPRESLRRDVLDAVSHLAHTQSQTHPHQALELLEHARVLDRYNEALYADIAQLQARLKQFDAIPRTLALLTTTLAELDEEPSPETVALCRTLQTSQDRYANSPDQEAS